MNGGRKTLRRRTIAIVTLTSAFGLAATTANAQKMYWTDAGTSKIQYANRDGSGVTDLITTGLETPQGIALDLIAGTLVFMRRRAVEV